MFDEDVRFILWIISISVGLSLAILQIYGVFKLYSIQHLIIVSKRYPKILIIESVAAILYLTISYMCLAYNVLKPAHISELLSRTGFILYPYLGHFIVNAELLRLWLMFYDINYSNAIKNHQWKSKIDSNITNSNNWYLNNKNKYGNIKWVTIRV
eukprot:411203_1